MSDDTEEKARRRNILMCDPDELVIAGLDTDDGPENPLVDPASNKAPVDEEMAASMVEYGVILPVVCKTVDGKRWADDGRTRIRAARFANKTLIPKLNRTRPADDQLDFVQVPVWMKRGDDAYMFTLSRLANRHRRHDNPMDVAVACQRAMDIFGLTEEQVAMQEKTTPDTVREWISLLDLPAKIKNAVARGPAGGGIGIGAALQLRKLDTREEQLATFEKLLEEGVKPTAANVGGRVRQAQGKDPTVTSKQRVAKALEALQAHAATLVDLPVGGDQVAVLDKVSLEGPTCWACRPLPLDASAHGARQPESGTTYHYVVVRADLPHGVQVAQTVHAAGESAGGPLPAGTYAVALQVPDEAALLAVAARLTREGCAHLVVRESGGPYDGQAMAVGVRPTADRKGLRRATSSLPLVR